MSLLDAMLLDPHRDPKDIWITRRTDGNKGSGTEADPYDGSTWERFDGLMRGFMQQNLEFISIHIGPGVFETKGNAPYDVNQGWEIRRGWKIVGSGIGVTTLKVVGATAYGNLISAVGQKAFATVADYAEVSELTVDCNFPTGSPMPLVAIGAVALKGSHVRVRRVRTIRFGTHQPYESGNPDNAPECFVIAVGGRAENLPEPTDCRIEDCIVEKRAAGIDGINNITCLIVSSGEEPGDGVMEHPRGGVIRHCYVDGAFDGGGVNLDHKVWGCAACGTGAVVEGNRFFNVRAGGPYHDFWPTKDVVVRGNYYHNVVVGPFENLGGWSTTSKRIKLASLTRVGTTATAITLKEHGFVQNDRVRIVNLSSDPPIPPDPNRFYYRDDATVTPDASEPKKFTYQMTDPPRDSSPPSDHHVPAYATGFLTSDDARRLLASLTYSTQGNEHIAEAKIADDEGTYGVAFEKHDFLPGDAVEIIRASHSAFNDRFTITETPDNKTFRFALKSDPGGNSPSGYYAKLWQTRRLIIEDNVIDLAEPGEPPIGILSYGYGTQVPPHRYREVVIRNNVIRHINNQRIPEDPSLAVSIESAQSVIIEGNTIQLEAANPIRFNRCGRVHSFNNRTPSGAVIEAYYVDSQRRSEDLSKKIEDALFMSF